jgi:ribosomal-protein-alanine N-acetyltransferase
MSDESVTRPTVLVRRAGPGDLGPIMTIERDSFPQPWPAGTISGDLRHPQQALYLLAEREGKPAAYLAGWFYDVELHLGSVATAPQHRRQGLSEILVLTALRYAARAGTERVILEYRVSNEAAAALYRKIGFEQLRIRKHYYADDLEDAVEAKMDDLQAAERQAQLEEKIRAWQEQYGCELRVGEL